MFGRLKAIPRSALIMTRPPSLLFAIWSCLVCAGGQQLICNNVLLNGDFTYPPTSTVPEGYVVAPDASNDTRVGWFTTEGLVEVGRSTTYGVSGWPYVADLNVNRLATWWQDLVTPPGTYAYSLAFAARLGLGNNSIAIQQGPPGGGLRTIATYTSSVERLAHFSGTFNVPAPQNKTRFALQGLKPIGSRGNAVAQVMLCAPYTVPSGTAFMGNQTIGGDVVLTAGTNTTAAAGALITITGSLLIFGTLDVGVGSTVVVQGAATISGALQLGSGATVIVSGVATISGGLQLASGATVIVSGVATISGGLQLASGASLVVSGAVTLSNSTLAIALPPGVLFAGQVLRFPSIVTGSSFNGQFASVRALSSSNNTCLSPIATATYSSTSISVLVDVTSLCTSSLSAGAVAGIVLACILVAGLATLLIVCFMRRARVKLVAAIAAKNRTDMGSWLASQPDAPEDVLH
jgi:hypothetical protein